MTAFLISTAVVAEKKVPVASLVVSSEFAVLGSVISLDGRLSSDPDGGVLTYHFSFVSLPIGSKAAADGFKTLDDIGALTSFSPDVVGQYVIGLVVSNGVFDSALSVVTIDVRSIAVPHGRGLVPDGKFIWSYLRDVWTQVDDREFFETLWSALIQIAGGELLKLYQIDFNKSIRDVQDLFQRRWMKYEPKLALSEGSSIFLGSHRAGTSAATGAAGETGLAVILDRNELVALQGTVRLDLAGRQIDILYSRNAENVGSYVIAGTTAKHGGFRLSTDLPKNPSNTAGENSDVIVRDVEIQFDFGSTTWSLGGTKRYDFVMSEILGFDYYITEEAAGLEEVRVGDVAIIKSGINVGLYRIVDRSGGYIVVDKKPAGSSLVGESSQVTIYRPVGFSIPSTETTLSDSISIPLAESADVADLTAGRLIVVNGQAYTVTRTAVDENQRVPLVAVSIDQQVLVPGLKSLAWRTPHTLVSADQDFEDLGVSTGDVLVSTITFGNVSVDVPCQVVGVDRTRLGFVFTDEVVTDGDVPEVSVPILMRVVEGLALKAGTVLPDGSFSASGDAATLLTYVKSIYFQRKYWGMELPTPASFELPLGTFTIEPKYILRNRLIPVDETVRSIPALQDFIVQPETVEDGGKTYLVKGEKRFLLARPPVIALEQKHYVVDGQSVLSGDITFRTGTNVFEVEGGDFVDLGIRPGDTLEIASPLPVAGSFEVMRVLSRSKLLLSSEISAHPLSVFVTGTVTLKRRRAGHFIRFVPGLFSAKSPAPARLWGEVTFYDNSENIERNFGVLVGLTRQDLEKVTSQASYRQAVAGLMYAYVNGPAVDKVRLGASLLLGLPFTERRGIIRSIDTAYRKDAYGNPAMGRILVEDLDTTDAATGVFRVYTFPVDLASELSGVDVNPATQKPYEVGDVVEAFASLSKGVAVEDSKTSSAALMTAVQRLQSTHSARIRINDTVFQPSEIGLVSSFLRRITPSYVALVISNTSEVQDNVTVDDKLSLNLRSPVGTAPVLVDMAGLNFPTAPIFDLRTLSGLAPMRWDEDPYYFLRGGSDLAIDNTGAISLASGGLVNPRTGESFEAPLVSPGDFLFVVNGPTEGVYPILTVTDSTLTIDGPQLSESAGQRFVIMRAIRSLRIAGDILNHTDLNFVDPDNGASYDYSEVTVDGGLRAGMVAPGDRFVAGGQAYTVIAIKKTGVVWDKVQITPILSGAPTTFAIYRPGTFTNELYTITADGTDSPTLPDDLLGLLDPGDELQVQQDDLLTSVVETVSPLKLTPAPPLGTYEVRLLKTGAGETPFLFDQSLRTITDRVTFTLTPVGV